MYDFELLKYLNERNYEVSTDEYLYICKTCPQIINVKYNAFSDEFEASTEDRNYFRFKVYHKE